MKRRGLINWSSQLKGPAPVKTNHLGISGADNTTSLPSTSPSRVAKTTKQQPIVRANGLVEFQAPLNIHEQQSNVLIAGLQDGAAEQIYLGDNEHFQPGDIVEIVPVTSLSAQQSNKAEEIPTRSTGSNSERAVVGGFGSQAQAAGQLGSRGAFYQNQQPQYQQQQQYQQHQQQAVGQSTASQKTEKLPEVARTSLVVSLNHSFYKANQQHKKFFVSIEQTLAEMHGFRKDMQVILRKIPRQELVNFSNKASVGQQKTNSNFAVRRDPAAQQVNQNQIRYHELVADRVEVTIRDQFASRRDMWNLVQKLSERTIHKGNQIDLQSVRFKIRNIFTGHKRASTSQQPTQSGFLRRNTNTLPQKLSSSSKGEGNEVTLVEQNSAVVMTSYTRFTFLTKSCQVYCLIELSKEMFTFDSEGFMQSEKCQLFVRSYLERCKADYSTHEVVFIIYARLYYPQVQNDIELLQEVQRHTGRRNLSMKDLQKEGAFQFSKNKVFQDVYLKAGVVNLTLDTTKQDYDKFLVQFKKYLQNFPRMVNWQIECPQSLNDTQATEATADSQGTQSKPTGNNSCFQLLPCELGESERTNILEVINLALFNLNNEETDLNLRTTGTQMLILTAGMATYRVNAAIISPTKSRLLLGGVQVQMISFAREPPYKTPVLIKCCRYTNPFEKKIYQSSHPMTPTKRQLYQSPYSGKNDINQRAQTHLSECQENSDQSHYSLEWIQVTFLPHIKLLETHLHAKMRGASALLQLSKTPLLAPQFCLFQQARLVTQVFGRLAKQDERLFEPHSMFVKSHSLLGDQYSKKSNKRRNQVKEEQYKQTQSQPLLSDCGKTEESFSSIEQKPVRLFAEQINQNNSQRSKKQNKTNDPSNQRKYWRLDPEMYQLRYPVYDNHKFLLLDVIPTTASQTDNTISFVQQNQMMVNNISQHERICKTKKFKESVKNNSENDSVGGGSTDEVLAFKMQNSSLMMSPQIQVVQDGGVTAAQMQAEALRENLRKKLMEYDAQVGRGGNNGGGADPCNNSLQSPVTSLASSPMKFMHNSLYDMSPSKKSLLDLSNENDTHGALNQLFKQNILNNQRLSINNNSQQEEEELTRQLSAHNNAVNNNRLTIGNIQNKMNVNQSQAQLNLISNPKSFIIDRQTEIATKKGTLQQSLIIQQQTNNNTMNNTTTNMIKKTGIDKERNLRSYARRWGHAIQIQQLSLFDKPNANDAGTSDSNSATESKQQKKPYSMSYDQLPEWGGYDKRHNAYDLAITQNFFDPLCKLMDPFWKQLSDVVLMPLTTQFYLNTKGKYYANELHSMDRKTDVEENLCLRLTQNFQFVHERGGCHFQPSKTMANKYHYRMAFRDIYSDCLSKGLEQFETQTHFKYKDEDSPIEEKIAAFRYLLFNHHTKHFQVKKSQESRLFEIRKLKNLDVVQSDLREAKEHCIKLPQVSFVIFYDRQEAQRLRAIECQQNFEQRPFTEEEEENEEKEAFEKLKDGIVTLLQGMGPHNKAESLRSIEVVRMSTIQQRNNLASVEEYDTMQQCPSQFTPPLASSRAPSSAMSSAAKQTKPWFAKEEVTMLGYETFPMVEQDGKVKWPQDMMGSVLGQPQTEQKHRGDRNNLAIPELESSRASGASSDFIGCGQMNMSMQMGNHIDMHASLANPQHLNPKLMQSSRATGGQRRKGNEEKGNSKKCVVNLSSSSQQQQQSQKLSMGQVKQQPVAEPSQYLLEHDKSYTTGACFHLRFSWIFARSPEIHERVIKRMFRMVKDNSNGCFKTLPMSEIVRSLQLNPFECETQLRRDYRVRATDALAQRNCERAEQLEQNAARNSVRLSSMVGEDFSMILYDDEDDVSHEGMSRKLGNRESRVARQTIVHQTSIIEEERVFQRIFPRLLITQCGYVLDNKSKDESCTYFVEKETGLSYLRYNTTNNEIHHSENDIVNNMHGDYQTSIKSREKVEATVFALDILLSLIYDPSRLP